MGGVLGRGRARGTKELVPIDPHSRRRTPAAQLLQLGGGAATSAVVAARHAANEPMGACTLCSASEKISVALFAAAVSQAPGAGAVEGWGFEWM